MKKYKQLSSKERQVIHKEFKKGTSIGTIAKLLDRNKSTISRELKRNSTLDTSTNELVYNPKEAQKLYMERFKIKKMKIDGQMAPRHAANESSSKQESRRSRATS